jgi:hypothetical protein
MVQTPDLEPSSYERHLPRFSIMDHIENVKASRIWCGSLDKKCERADSGKNSEHVAF